MLRVCSRGYQLALGPVHLSILIATNRSNLLACSRIAQACSWAGPDVEVIVRDNSGDAQKRALLPHFQRENCNIIIAEPCDILTNVSEVLKLAKGEFVFILSDDDFCFDHAIASLPSLIGQHGRDPSVAGVIGFYAIETSKRSEIVTYQDLESDDVAKRVAGYLSYGGPNVLYYAPVRREVVQRVFALMNTLPLLFSFHDQIICLLYVLSGKYVRIDRLLYLHDVGVWETRETAQQKDVEFYKAAGLDPVINMLHWLLCAFEGAVLVRNSDLFPDYPLAQRQTMADRWFSAMYIRFKGDRRAAYGSPLIHEAEKLCAKLRTASGQLTFQNLLADICSFMAVASKDKAQKYFDFWDATLSKREPSLRKTGT